MGKRHKHKRQFIRGNELDSIWDSCFGKRYSLQIANSDHIYMQKEELDKFFSTLDLEKEKLNLTKSLLNSMDIEEWRKHTTKMHKCGFIMAYLRKQIDGELVTQAWAKFYTILSTFSMLLSLETKQLNTVHLCEAPGAFVTSLNHCLKDRFGDVGFQWEWTASTLNPYYEGNDSGQMVPDDRFIIETLPHWDFGVDFTGNVLSYRNLNHFKDHFNSVQVNIVTADGSIDCSENPGEQENIVSLLFLWETVTALSILSNGGSFVLKIFTVFEKFTISLLYMLSSVFQEVTLIKPGPSKPGNSEVYIVSQGFMQDDCLNSSLFKLFLNAAFTMNVNSAVVNFTEVPKSFLVVVKEYVEKSCSAQSQTIKENIEAFSNWTSKNEYELKQVKHYIAERFIQEYKIRPIDDYVSKVFMMKSKERCYCDRTKSLSYKRGSYNERSSRTQEDMLKSSMEFYGESNYSSYINSSVQLENRKVASSDELETWFCNNCSDSILEWLPKFDFILGKRFQDVNSSSFCNSVLLRKYFIARKTFSPVSRSRNLYEELYELEENYPIVQITRVKNVLFISALAEYNGLCTTLKERGMNVCYIEPGLSGSYNGSIADWKLCLCSIANMSKVNNLLCIITLLKHLHHKQNAVIEIDHILTNFWAGVLFVLTHLFSKITFFTPRKFTGCSYLVCVDFNANKEIVDMSRLYMKRLCEKLTDLPADLDVLQIVPIYNLMQSDFRAFLTCHNESLLRYCIEKIYQLNQDPSKVETGKV